MSRALDGLAVGLAALVVSDLVVWWWRPENLFLLLLGAVTVRSLLRPYALPAWRPARVVLGGVLAYALLFSFITINRHWGFRTHALDLGYYVQLLWSISQGLGPHVSLPEMHAWGDHFSPTLYLLVPLFALFPSPVTLLIAQSVVFSLGALPFFALARRRLDSDTIAAAFALLYLLSPTLHGINVRDFHIAAFAIPLLLTAVDCFERGKMAWFFLAVVLTLGCREDAALPVIGLGLWIALARRRWVLGLALAAASLALLVFDVWVLMPYFRGEPYPHLHRYAHLGGSLGEIMFNIVFHPFRTLGVMWSGEKLVYLLALLAPLGFLPLLAPLDILPALPALIENLVTNDHFLFSYRTQYNSFVLPFLLLAAVSGYARLSPNWSLIGRPIRGVAFAASFLLSLALTSRTVNALAVRQWWPSERRQVAHHVLAQVPPGVSVSAWDRFAPHLAKRPKVFLFPGEIEQSEYVVLDGTALPRDVRLERNGSEVVLSVAGSEGTARYRYEVVREAEGYLILKRLAS
jgi:uncharacterized membrane protein